jgi:hypothetical protein
MQQRPHEQPFAVGITLGRRQISAPIFTSALVERDTISQMKESGEPPVSGGCAMAEKEAYEYADSLSGYSYVGHAQAYELFEPPGHGTEVLLMMRDSSLATEAYVNTFFDAGDERQGGVFEP